MGGALDVDPRGMVSRMAIGAPFLAGPEPARFGVRLKGPPPPRITPARARAIAAAEGGLAFSKAALAEAAACSSGVIDNLIGEGTLETIALPPEPAALASIRLSPNLPLKPRRKTPRPY